MNINNTQNLKICSICIDTRGSKRGTGQFDALDKQKITGCYAYFPLLIFCNRNSHPSSFLSRFIIGKCTRGTLLNLSFSNPSDQKNAAIFFIITHTHLVQTHNFAPLAVVFFVVCSTSDSRFRILSIKDSYENFLFSSASSSVVLIISSS